MKLKTHPPGVYFGMPEDEYHADPSFSSSVAKDMLVSPLTAWCRHYDPDREEDSDTAAQVKGKATHKAILEGTEAFEAAYAVRPDPDEYRDHIRGGAALKDECKRLGVKASGTLVEMSKRIREADPSALLWADVDAEFGAAINGRTALDPDVGAYVRRTAGMVTANAAVRKAVQGGFPEVSIFWHDNGIPWKCRIDYLKTRAAVDLKTFTNMNNKPLDVAIAHAVAQHRYHMQAAIYLRGLKAAASLEIKGRNAAHDAWLQQWRSGMAEPRFVFLFVESGNIPNVALREFREKNADRQETVAHMAASAAVDQAATLWADHMERFGPDQPWVSDTQLRPFSDEEFPLYMME